MRHKAWGLLAIALGVWETVAFTTRRCPTISATYASLFRRNKHVAHMLLLGFQLGLYRHLKGH